MVEKATIKKLNNVLKKIHIQWLSIVTITLPFKVLDTLYEYNMIIMMMVIMIIRDGELYEYRKKKNVDFENEKEW